MTDEIKCKLCYEIFEWSYGSPDPKHSYFIHLVKLHNVGFPEVLDIIEELLPK